MSIVLTITAEYARYSIFGDDCTHRVYVHASGTSLEHLMHVGEIMEYKQTYEEKDCQVLYQHRPISAEMNNGQIRFRLEDSMSLSLPVNLKNYMISTEVFVIIQMQACSK